MDPEGNRIGGLCDPRQPAGRLIKPTVGGKQRRPFFLGRLSLLGLYCSGCLGTVGLLALIPLVLRPKSPQRYCDAKGTHEDAKGSPRSKLDMFSGVS